MSDVLTIAHDIPGRLRVRLPDGARTDGLADALRSLEGVASCEWSPRTRGLLIRYDPARLTSAGLVAAVVGHAGVDPPDPASLERHSGALNGNGPPAIGAAIAGSVADLNSRIGRATAGRLNLALVVPIGLTLWAVFDVMRGPIRPLAWTTALWYAHGLFRDYALPDAQK